MPLSPRDETIALISLGCAKNLVDSEVMLGSLAGSGFRFTGDPARADIILINTCGFIKPAREEAEDAIRRAVALKKQRPGRRIAVVGCYVARARERLASAFPEVDVWLGVGDFDRIGQALMSERFRERQRTFLLDDTFPRVVSTPAGWAYLKISEGCSHGCGFCSIPLIKGPYRSRSVSSIVREAERLAAIGVKEINLISHDTTYYGRDRGMRNGLVSLLDKLIGVHGLAWIRLLYGYPEEVSDGLLETMNEEKICPYLDIPFQHADRTIVKAMRRGLDGIRALRLIGKIRDKVPGIALRTSLVVGFPGEGKKEFSGLLAFIREARFDHLGVFAYSPEEGTASLALGDPISGEEKVRRQETVMALQAEMVREKNESQVGKTLDVLVEGRVEGTPSCLCGRTKFQAPEVDGIVLIKAGRSGDGARGSIRRVEITAADGYDLQGCWLS